MFVVLTRKLIQQESDKQHWTTAEQWEFLAEYIPKYLEAQASRNFGKFWPALYQKWFAQYPVGEPTNDDPTDSECECDSEPNAFSEDESTPGQVGCKCE